MSPYFLDNKYNVAPKIMAEANRPDGFKMLSLGYANGFDAPKPGIDVQTLLTGSTGLGFDILLTDVNEALAVGFLPYTTSASVDFVNSFAKNNMPLTDLTAPQWSSVYNASYDPPAASIPRVGVQKAVVEGPGTVTLSWDVALDMHKVSYNVYYQTTPFDFVSDARLAFATKQRLSPSVGAGYSAVWNSNSPSEALQLVYPYQQTLTGLQTGVTYYFVIRAIDSAGNEDANTVFLTATP